MKNRSFGLDVVMLDVLNFKPVAIALVSASLLLAAGCASSGNRKAANSLADAKARFAIYETNKVHYVALGQGKQTLVLVHCWAGNLNFWREQVPVLASKARLVLIDLPGHGQSDKPHAAYSMDFFADAVLVVRRDAHVDRATLIGHSMGVPVICRVYHQEPRRVAALISIDGTLRRPKMTAEQAEQFVAQFRDPDYRTKTTEFMKTMFPVPGTEAVRDWVISQMLETPQYVMVGAMNGMFATDQPDWDLHHVDVPVLVLNAPNQMWNDEYKEYVRKLSLQTDYRMIEGVGHWFMLEKPAEFNAALTAMLQKFDLIAE
jgi:pimeloyl-ACP methyl ester carboxylesterase